MILTPAVRGVVSHGHVIVDRREVVSTIFYVISCTFGPLVEGVSVYHQSRVESLHLKNPPTLKKGFIFREIQIGGGALI